MEFSVQSKSHWGQMGNSSHLQLPADLLEKDLDEEECLLLADK